MTDMMYLDEQLFQRTAEVVEQLDGIISAISLINTLKGDYESNSARAELLYQLGAAKQRLVIAQATLEWK
ncbi:MAG: hypothetical protein NZM11_00790 [Anaerolineales bacterium]|nr:hypothetical protein [Anaerolineales bacterium]